MKYDDLPPRGRAFFDAYHRGDPDEMDRLVTEQIQEEYEEIDRRMRKGERTLFFLVFASLAFLALIVSRWIESL